jgi:hypothetical protein
MGKANLMMMCHTRQKTLPEPQVYFKQLDIINHMLELSVCLAANLMFPGAHLRHIILKLRAPTMH